jgi:adenosylcobyric acid synthase
MVRTISVLGSGSDVGKSLVATGLCRLLVNIGLDVAPFKAQNMSNQAGVTYDGLELPRAQILQAAACRIDPHVDMGPVILKPISPMGAQIIVLGKARGQKSAKEYFNDTDEFSATALAALDRLKALHDIIIIEGAGSPVELNLWHRDYVNLRTARHANAALILVVDIHKGGVFAQAKGTLDLLPPNDRKQVLGVIINKFHGDINLFEDGIPLLEKVCKTSVLAVLPHFEHGLDEEDKPIQIPINQKPKNGKLHVGAILSPRISNTDDLAPLLYESDIQLTWLTDPSLALVQDVLILPGSKATIDDLIYHTASGMTEAILQASQNGTWILGICGGYQMLGRYLSNNMNNKDEINTWPGLNLLPIRTIFHAEKIVSKNQAISAWPEAGHKLTGYEIHSGHTTLLEGHGESIAQFKGVEFGWRCERICGTYLHGLLACDSWRNIFFNNIRQTLKLPIKPINTVTSIEARIERWAQHMKTNLRPKAWEKIIATVSNT